MIFKQLSTFIPFYHIVSKDFAAVTNQLQRLCVTGMESVLKPALAAQKKQYATFT